MGVSDLVLDEVTDDDAGLYTCVVASLLGMTQQSAWLTVLPVVSEYQSRQFASNFHSFAHKSFNSWSVVRGHDTFTIRVHIGLVRTIALRVSIIFLRFLRQSLSSSRDILANHCSVLRPVRTRVTRLVRTSVTIVHGNIHRIVPTTM